LALQVQNCFFWSISAIISYKKYCLFQQGGWGSAASSPSWVRSRAPEAKAFL